MTMDWLLRVGDGINFMISSTYKIWGIKSQTTCGKHFMKAVHSGDRLWFVKNTSKGKIIAVATYHSHNSREFGPLLHLLHFKRRF